MGLGIDLRWRKTTYKKYNFRRKKKQTYLSVIEEPDEEQELNTSFSICTVFEQTGSCNLWPMQTINDKYIQKRKQIWCKAL